MFAMCPFQVQHAAAGLQLNSDTVTVAAAAVCRSTFDEFLKAFFCVLFAAMGLAQAQVSTQLRLLLMHTGLQHWARRKHMVDWL
jgi:hypothetical protein